MMPLLMKSGNTIAIRQKIGARGQRVELSSVVNGQFFVSEGVALKIVLDFGGEEMRKILQSAFDAIYDEDKNYELYFEKDDIYQALNKDLKLLALHVLAEEDRFWNSFYYARNDRISILYRRASGILNILGNLI